MIYERSKVIRIVWKFPEILSNAQSVVTISISIKLLLSLKYLPANVSKGWFTVFFLSKRGIKIFLHSLSHLSRSSLLFFSLRIYQWFWYWIKFRMIYDINIYIIVYMNFDVCTVPTKDPNSSVLFHKIQCNRDVSCNLLCHISIHRLQV